MKLKPRLDPAVLEERVNNLAAAVTEKFLKAERDLDLARGQYPTREDITKGLAEALTSGRTVAREEAEAAYRRAAGEGKSESEKAAAALRSLTEQTERSALGLSVQLGSQREECLDKVKELRDEVHSAIEDVKSSQTSVVVLAGLGFLSGIGGFVSLFLT